MQLKKRSAMMRDFNRRASDILLTSSNHMIIWMDLSQNGVDPEMFIGNIMEH